MKRRPVVAMPELSVAKASAIASRYFRHFGVATPLPGEYGQNFRIATDTRQFVLKVSSPTLSQELLAAQQFAMARLDGALPYKFPTPVGDNEQIAHLGNGNHATLVNWVEGPTYAQIGRPPQLAWQIGRMAGAVADTLSSFEHPALHRESEWDLGRAADVLDELTPTITDLAGRRLVARIASDLHHRQHQLVSLPRQVIHGDINDLNVITTDDRVVGLIDFGDLVHSLRIAELAIATTYVLFDQDDPIKLAAEVARGFCSRSAVTAEEAAVLFDMIRARMAVSVAMAASRSGRDNAHMLVSESDAWNMLWRFESIDSDYGRAALVEACGYSLSEFPADDLVDRRRKVLGAALSLSYEESSTGPLHITYGSGAYLYDRSGKRFLDCVNNVAHVGHGHTRVVAAASEQMRLLNTNTRYLHNAIVEYAEMLLGKLPGMEVVYFVNSGSEANELALRMAQAATGRTQMSVLDNGYHGNTSSMMALSPYKSLGRGRLGTPQWVTILPIPDSSILDPIAATEISANPAAGLLAESIVGCGGQLVPDSAGMRALERSIRRSGGLIIADEVQTGFGRVGSEFWAFQLHGLRPDIVTMGKPIGNGHPMGAVATTQAVADAFATGIEYFNTFGGNPVSAAVGKAVLEVIEDEELQAHAANVGTYLLSELRSLAASIGAIVDARGAGLFLGVELTSASKTSHAVSFAKDCGVLLSIDGPCHNVIKIKPPMVFSRANADRLLSVLRSALEEEALGFHRWQPFGD